MKIELEGQNGDSNVISIEAARKSRFDRKCQHYHIYVDPDFATIDCQDCERQLNPIEWLAFMCEEWERIQKLYRLYADAKDLYEEKRRTLCEHCKKITRINTPTDFSKRMRAKGHMVY